MNPSPVFIKANSYPFLGLLIFFSSCTFNRPVSLEPTSTVPKSTPSSTTPPQTGQVTAQSLIAELNSLRTNPAGYSRYLREWLPHFQGNVLALPNQIPKQSREGKRAVIEAIQVLDNQISLKALQVSAGLSKAAQDHVKDQSKSGAIGHDGADGSHIWDRADRYGKWNVEVGEAIAYGRNDARSFILQLLVDDGVADRGHRKSLLDPRWNWVGASIGSHPTYNSMCVLTFAIQYAEQ